MVQTIQQVVQLAVEKCGGQSALAREITKRFKVPATQQRVEHLLKVRGKLARRSELMPYILKIVGMDPTWSPAQVQNGDARKGKAEPLRRTRKITVRVRETGKVTKVEMTTEALRVAKLFMDLDIDDRKEVVAKVEALEIKRKAMKGEKVPDERLHHLARTDTPEGRALAEKGKAKKRMSRHSS